MLDPVLNAVKKVEVRFSNLFSRFRNKKITVQAGVKGVEQVEEAKRKLESLPNAKTVKMKVEKSGDYSEFQVSSLKSQVRGAQPMLLASLPVLREV